MNVVKYSIEVSKKKKNNSTITDLITTALKQNLQFEGEYETVLKSEWDNLEHESIKTLYSPKYLIGAFTKNNIRIFLFKNDLEILKIKTSASLDILAIGDLNINNIVNDSFKELTLLFPGIKCDYIKDSRIFLYPYDNVLRDIWSSDLKIKAIYDPSYNYEKKDFIRIAIISLITVLFLIIYLSTPAIVKNENGIDTLNNINIIYRSLFISGLFYLIIDTIVNFIIPFLFFRKRKYIKIRDLSNFIELTGSNPFVENINKKKLIPPKIPE